MRARDQRIPQRTGRESAVPVVLPYVLVTVDDDGALTVTVDGEPFDPPTGAEPWRRASFGALIDAVTEQRRVPVRVEVRESDGTVFTDIITPARPTPPAPTPESQPEREPSQPRAAEVAGEGFTPGEDVAVAVIVATTTAAPDGAAHMRLDPARLATSAAAELGEVVLLGRTSGAHIVGRPR